MCVRWKSPLSVEDLLRIYRLPCTLLCDAIFPTLERSALLYGVRSLDLLHEFEIESLANQKAFFPRSFPSCLLSRSDHLSASALCVTEGVL